MPACAYPRHDTVPTMSLRDEAPEGAPSPCETMVRKESAPKGRRTHVVRLLYRRIALIYQEHFDADSNTSRTSERRRAYLAPVALVGRGRLLRAACRGPVTSGNMSGPT